jgi:hypothetical protein
MDAAVLSLVRNADVTLPGLVRGAGAEAGDATPSCQMCLVTAAARVRGAGSAAASSALAAVVMQPSEAAAQQASAATERARERAPVEASAAGIEDLLRRRRAVAHADRGGRRSRVQGCVGAGGLT